MRLRNQLLRWLLVPLVGLWAIGFAIEYRRSIEQANVAYDRTLLGSALVMAERVTVLQDQLSLDLPYAALEMLETGAQDRIFYKVSFTGSRRPSTGYDDLPPPPREPGAGQPVFYEAPYLGEQVRLVALLKPLYGAGDTPLLVQVGQTLAARDELAQRILLDGAATQLALIVAVALLIVFAVRRGLAPLARVRREVRAREPGDLTPIDSGAVPREVAPLVDAINLHTERQRQLNDAQRQFIADASHQLKTPLTVLKTQAAIAIAQDEPEAMRRIVKEMHDSTDLTARVVQQLLALARSEPGLVLPDEHCDLVEIARHATFDLLPQALKKQVDLGFDGDGRAIVEGQPLLLRELVSNLVDNAVRYSPERGTVTVTVRRAADVELVVEDNGPGIAPEQRAKVFDRFYRVGGTAAEGCGLGLAIVKQIADRHHATIEIGSGAGGVGAKFTVRVPAADLTRVLAQ